MNSRKNIITSSLFIIFLLFLLAACSPAAPAETTSDEGPVTNEIILATTTSTRDSGLLDVLIPIFEEKSGYVVKMVAVGTGEALQMGEEGNADVLLVHAPASEMELMDGGYGKDRYLVMHNDFVFVGPADDPAKIKGIKSPAEALTTIAEAGTTFVSRGDDSGTHKKELYLWGKTDITPAENDAWYLQTGQGMGDTLRVASEKSGYTLTDRATYLALNDTLSLEIMVEGDSSLLNVYHVITVNPDKFPMVNAKGGQAFADFLVDPEIQETIGKFGVEEFGSPLFYPDADKTDADLGL